MTKPLSIWEGFFCTMEALLRIANNAKKLNEIRILVKIYRTKSVSDFIVELNRTNQLFREGEYTNETVVGVYSVVTEEFYNPNKKAGDPYDFFDTGDFFNSFEVLAESDGSFTIQANDLKDNGVKLTEKYNDGELLGLSVPNTTKLVETILPFFIRETKKALFS